MDIRLGNQSDIENWMRLVDKVKEAFPGLETKEELREGALRERRLLLQNICSVLPDNQFPVQLPMCFHELRSMLGEQAIKLKNYSSRLNGAGISSPC